MSGPAAGWPAIVFTLQRADHTAQELAKITGLAENGVHRTLLMLEAEGLAERLPNQPRTGRGRDADRWRWNHDA